MADDGRLRVLGSPASPYTRKVLAALRYRRIPHVLLLDGIADVADLPPPRVRLLPTVYFHGADGRVEAAVDSTPILRRLERSVPERRVVPADPVLAFLCSLVEDYADEWLTRPMFHFRWSADATHAALLLAWHRSPVGAPEAVAAQARTIAAHQRARLWVVGSSPATAAAIERGYERFLALFAARLSAAPFVFGSRPSSADFAIYGQLSQLARLDPTPRERTFALAPQVTAWTDRVDDLSGLEPQESDWASRAEVGALAPLVAEIAGTHLPLLFANASAMARGDAEYEATVDGAMWSQRAFPYHAKCLDALAAEYARLATPERRSVDALLGDLAARELADRGGCA